MKKHWIVVEHRQPEQVKALRREIENLRFQVRDLKTAYQNLENKYGYEVYLNGELVDLLREHQIPFRQLLSHEERAKRYKGET